MNKNQFSIKNSTFCLLTKFKMAFYIFSILIFNNLNAQTKKEQILALNSKVDSLNINLKNARDSIFLERKSNVENKIILNKLIKEYNDSSKELAYKLDLWKQKYDSLKNSKIEEISKLTDSIIFLNKNQYNELVLPFSKLDFITDKSDGKLYNTVFLDFNNKKYIVTDTITTIIKDRKPICLFFLTSIVSEGELNLECPNDYGVIIVDYAKNILFKSFWNNDNWNNNTKDLLSGNCKPGLLKFNINSVEKNILKLHLSGCGSGGNEIYYELLFDNNQISFKKIISCDLGYSSCYFMDAKQFYLKVEKINPDCHYGCPSIYEISRISLLDNKTQIKYKTKYKYEDFSNTEIELLLMKIKLKEPEMSFF